MTLVVHDLITMQLVAVIVVHVCLSVGWSLLLLLALEYIVVLTSFRVLPAAFDQGQNNYVIHIAHVVGGWRWKTYP